MRLTSTIVLVTVTLVAAATPLHAHHAFASEFDARKPVKFTATVTKMEWINPHSWMHVEVKKPDGTVETWMIEAGSPNSLFRRGINKNTVKPGMVVVVDGYQARDGSRRANGRDVTLPEGQRLFLGSGGTGAPYDASAGSGSQQQK
ncbi:MAG: DUF6152 family protein [Vicinamibacterales bacterium]